MGGCSSKDIPPVTAEEKKRARDIDNSIKRDKKEMEKEVKLLLLGAGESGKSTIAKQMRIIFLEGFSDEEKLHFREVIYLNILISMRSLILGARKLGITIENQALAEKYSEVASAPSELSEETVNNLKTLWNDVGIKKAFDRSNEFQLYDSTSYYFGELTRIGQKNYVPNEQDILRSRAKTTGIIETEFEVQDLKFKLVDVGGQRSERKKWIHCFEDVTAVVFCVAMSEYDQTLYEDENVRRLDESVKLFDEICNSKWFSETSVILFLNKSDIFREKIKKHDLSVYFPDYKGGADFEQAVACFQQYFEKLNRNPVRKDIYPHVTCATDTKNINFVFNAVKDIILRQILESGGVL